MIELAGTAALVIGDMSSMAGALARALVTAGASVALVDVDEGRSAVVADELTRAGGVAIAVPASDPARRDVAIARAETELGPLTLHCDLTGLRPELATAAKHFMACRWTSVPGSRDVLALAAQPLTGLAAMALLVPGSLTTRPAFSSGVVAARLFGPDRDRAVVESGHDVLTRGAGAAELADMIVAGAASRRLVIMTRQEWNGSARRNADDTLATLHTLDEHRAAHGAVLVSA